MLYRLIYGSRSLCTLQETVKLVDSARITNALVNVTGALYLTDDKFLQYLEGEREVIEEIFKRIKHDRRHTECVLLDLRPIISRVFANWPMGWLRQSKSAALLMNTLLADNEHLGRVSGTSFGSFFYAMATTGEFR